ncbi:MAG: hypothetical protein B1H07_04660 [Campylobacteraceae bacterium 4484_166]|nr:MAG: hypothetical protein B1H07_04660 [Campylobacteraceae bacterium 4484_166]
MDLTKKNKIYFNFILILLILPQIYSSPTIKHTAILFLLILFLWLLSNINKILSIVFIFYITIINIFQIHIFTHWGRDGSMSDRIGVVMQSPAYEMIEYLDSFVGFFDILFALYSFIVFFILAWLLLKIDIKQIKFKKRYIFFSIILLLGLQNQEPLKLIKYYFQTSKINNSILERKLFLQKYKPPKKEENFTHLYDKIVIIQGEAANKHHLRIYGYNKPTTPFLSKLELEQSNMFYKYQAFAPTNQTRYSVPMLFTPANVDKFYKNFSSNQSIITDFKHKGYKTYWISNQDNIGIHEDSIVNIAYEADETKFLNDGTTDAVLINYLKQIKTNKNKELFVFHLMGSHVKYKQRYKKDSVLVNDSKTVVDEYDNTIYYTDSILANIFEHFNKQKQKTIFIYISDHGEVVDTKKHGHGFFPSFKDEYDIPFVVYSSIKNEKLDELLQQNNKKFNLENLNYIIKYITSLQDENNISFSNKIFSLSPKNKLDYNKLEKYNKGVKGISAKPLSSTQVEHSLKKVKTN